MSWRRSAASGIVPSGPSRRAGRRRAGRRRDGGRRPRSPSATAGPGATAHAPPATTMRSGAGRADLIRRRLDEDRRARLGRRRGGARRPRRRPRTTARDAARAAGRAADAGRAGSSTRPGRDRRRVVGVGRDEAGLGDGRGRSPRLGVPPTPGAAVARSPPSNPISTISTRRSSDVGERGGRPGDGPARVVGGRRGLVEQLAERRAGRVAGRRRGAEQHLAWRLPSAASNRGELLGHRAGEDDGELGTAGRDRGDEARRARRARAARRPPAARRHRRGRRRPRVEEDRRHRQRIGRLGARGATRQPLRRAASVERRDGPLGGRDRGQARRPSAPGTSRGRSAGGSGAVDAERRASSRVGRRRSARAAAERGRRPRSPAGTARRRGAASGGDPADQRGRRGRGPQVEGEEGRGSASPRHATSERGDRLRIPAAVAAAARTGTLSATALAH